MCLKRAQPIEVIVKMMIFSRSGARRCLASVSIAMCGLAIAFGANAIGALHPAGVIQQLVRCRQVVLADAHAGGVGRGVGGNAGDDVAGRLAGERKQLTVKELKELKMGAHYGGAEFLNMIIDACMIAVSRTQPDLPSPVDPTV